MLTATAYPESTRTQRDIRMKDGQHITSRTLCHPSSPLLHPSPLLHRRMPLQRRRGRRRSFWGCSATLGPRETRCPPRRRPPPRPPQETRTWSSRSRTCCSWPESSTRAFGGRRPHCTGLAEELAVPGAPLPPPPPLRRGLCSCSVEWSRWSGMNVGRREKVANHRAGCRRRLSPGSCWRTVPRHN